jgi:hypothetical protein
MMKKLNAVNKKIITALLLSGLVVLPNLALAEQNLSMGQTEVEQFSQAQLEQVLAPIALYPDTLLTHILIAATYPIEVIDADRFVKQNEDVSEREIANKLSQKDWDPSVKALISFPRILANLSDDLGWMRKLGDAFLQSESQVLASIQILRQKADDAGNLSQMDNVEIVREKQTIIIEPAEPEVIYVPYYDTRVVYGNWRWAHYPPIYWHRPIHYSYNYGPFYWRPAVHIGFDFFFSAFHWSNHHVVRHHHKQRYYHSNKRIATSHHAKRWNHNPQHRRGVAYRSNKVKHRYSSNRPSVEHNRVLRKQYKNVSLAHQNGVKRGERYAQSKHETQKHRQVSKRLKVNKAVKINHRTASIVKSQKIKANNKYYSNNKVKKHEKFKAKPSRVVEKRSFKNKQNQLKSKVASNQVKSTQRDTWKKQPRIEKVKSKPMITQSKQRKQEVKYKNKKAKGGHSSKQYARVTKNNSRSTKSHSTRNR